MRSRRALTLLTVAFGSACSLVYSSYDSRFSAATIAPLATDDSGIKIEGLAVSTAGVFFYFSNGTGSTPTIKVASLDGGAVAPWWTGAASVTAMTSDSTGKIAWVAGGTLWVADVSSPDAASTMATGLQGTSDSVAADPAQLSWLGNVYPGKCPTGGCTVGSVGPWAGGGTALTAHVDASNVSPHALAVDNFGVSVSFDAQNTTEFWLARFAADAGLACLTRWSEAVQIATTQGSLFAVDTSGNLSEYATDPAGCPTTVLTVFGAQTVALTADATGIYWINRDGDVLMASSGADAGTRVGSVGPAPSKTIAVDIAAVYVASGASIYRFSKAL
jgi:hypothetical protein